MTREEAIKTIQKFMNWFKYDSRIYKALEMAISALEQTDIEQKAQEYEKAFMDGFESCSDLFTRNKEQEPCDDTVSIRKDVLKCRVGKLVVYNVEWLKKHWQMEMDIVCGVKPCDDAISVKIGEQQSE